MTKLMREGAELEFVSEHPPLALVPPSGLEPSGWQLPILREKVQELLSEGYAREIRIPTPLFFSRLFLVPKKEGWRMIIDLSRLNKFLVYKHFKMSTVQQIGVSILQPMWGSTMDAKDAYLNIPMAL